MNPDDYDDDGNCIVPCPICNNVHCPSNSDDSVPCPEEADYIQSLQDKDNLST